VTGRGAERADEQGAERADEQGAGRADEQGHVLEVRGLHASAGGREVLHGIDLTVRSGEVHVIMGPNGSGKSTLAHALMGRPGTEVTAGSVVLDGTELTGLPAWQRARAGLFVALQHPVEVPGVSLHALLAAAAVDGAGSGSGTPESGADLQDRMVDEAKAVGLDTRLLARPLNVDLSGGERKRTEMVQLGVLRPAICILDEVDSGLDVDALGEVARRLQQSTTEWGVGILAITHFNRFLVQLEADLVHVLVGGRIVATGDAALALELERTGYAGYTGYSDAR
jgi:Fe-S cluster assembly ATP-binding protein